MGNNLAGLPRRDHHTVKPMDPSSRFLDRSSQLLNLVLNCINLGRDFVSESSSDTIGSTHDFQVLALVDDLWHGLSLKNRHGGGQWSIEVDRLSHEVRSRGRKTVSLCGAARKRFMPITNYRVTGEPMPSTP